MSGKVRDGGETTLDLVDFCKRALWEWQACTELSGNGQVVAVDEDAPFPPPRSPLPPKDPGFLIIRDQMKPPLQWDLMFPTKVQDRVRASDMRVLQLTTVDLVGINYDQHPNIPKVSEEQLKKFDWSKLESLQVKCHGPAHSQREITTIRKYGQLPSWMTATKDPYTAFGELGQEKDFPLKEEAKGFLENMEKVWTPAKKAEVYWIRKLQTCQGKVLSAILSCVPALKKQGYRQWVLPNGRKVPLDSLTIIEFGIVPKTVALIRIEVIAPKLRAIIPGEGKYKNMLEIQEDQEHSRYWDIYAKDYDEGRGTFTFRHYALTTTVDMDPKSTLQAKDFYIVDPTVRQWGGQGPLILCGEMNKYVTKFPGEILSVDLMPAWQMQLFSQRRLVDFMTSNLLKYLKTPICNYCGEVDKYRPDPKHFTDNCTYTFDNVSLLRCNRCKEVNYCGKFCQTMDWKTHKKVCGGGSKNNEAQN